VTQVVINGEHFLTAKRGEAELIDEKRWTFLSGRSAQDAATGERVHLRLGRSLGSSPAQSLEPLPMTMLITLS
jgi:hypothetical protein